MQKQDTLRNILISAAIFLLLMSLAPRLFPPPSTAPSQQSAETTPPVSGDGGATPRTGATSAPPSGSPAPTSEKHWTVDEATDIEAVTIGAESTDGLDPKVAAPYRMRLTLSNVGAFIESATMTDHAQTLHSNERYELLSPVSGHDEHRLNSLAIEKLNVQGEDIDLSHGKWHVGAVEPYTTPARVDASAEEGMSATFWIDVLRDGQPALRLTRTFRLPKQPRDLHRHDLHVELRAENRSESPLDVVVAYRGGVGVPPTSPRQDDRVIDFGLAAGSDRVVVTRKPVVGTIQKTGDSVPLYRVSPSQADARFSWAATANTYFTCTVAPLDSEFRDAPGYVADVSAVDLDRNPLTTGDATVRFVTGALTVPPGSSMSYPASIYLGEKDGVAFKKVPDYARRNYYDQISLGFGWCTFTWLVELMIWLLNGLHFVVRDYGVAIIILVLIVRTLLHPITKKGQVNMVRMQQRMGDFAPKMEELKRKYANDKARLQQETMALYREQGINPATQMLGCLPMLLQMPIWVALFLSLSNNIGMRHQGFLFTWVQDLTAPDALIPFSTVFIVPFFGWHIASFNLLPPLVSVFMYIQQKTQPKPKPNPNMTEQQRQQQQTMQMMMPMMCIMMLFFFYNAPSGLNLYIMFSSFFGWIEQNRIRADIKAHEEAGTLLKPPTKPPAKTDLVASPRKRRDQMTWLEKLQNMAEEAQKARPKRAAEKKGRR